MKLTECLKAWGGSDFARLFKAEVESLRVDELLLQQQLCRGSVALDDDFEVMLLSSREEDGWLRVKAGVFFRGIIAGSCCIDDPTPVEPQEEYCELQFRIDRNSGEAVVEAVP